MLLPESDFAARIEAQGKAAILLIWENIPETTHVYFFPEVEGERLQEMITCQDCHIGGTDLTISQEQAMTKLSEFLETSEAKKHLLRGASSSSEEVPDPSDFEGGEYGEDDCQEDYLDACAEYKEATEDFVIELPLLCAIPNLVVIRCGFFM